MLILDGNLETVADVKSNLCYLICLRHLIGSSAVLNRGFFFSEKKTIFLHACATCSEIPSNIVTIVVQFFFAQIDEYCFFSGLERNVKLGLFIY